MKQKIALSLILALTLNAPALARGGDDSTSVPTTSTETHHEVEVSTQSTSTIDSRHGSSLQTEHASETDTMERHAVEPADQETKKADKLKHCDVQADKINDHLAKADKHADSSQKHEQALVNRVLKVEAKYEAAPYNVSTSDTRITTIDTDLSNMKAQFELTLSAHQKYVADLLAVASAACGDRAAAHQTARADFQTWKDDVHAAQPLRVKLLTDLADLISTAKKSSDSTDTGATNEVSQ